jgi:ornithine cyclodeaminase/alanine dehydrogenase-like protein (mu-crystallin family)
VIIGQKEARWQETTIFKSVGLAIEDVISAKIVYDEYMKQNTEQLPSYLLATTANNLSLH